VPPREVTVLAADVRHGGDARGRVWG
jgi:hypothetical protein